MFRRVKNHYSKLENCIIPESACTHSWRQCGLEFGLIQRLMPPCPVWKIWKVIFDVQLPGFTVNSCFITHSASNMLEDSFAIWIDITLRNRFLGEREKNMNNRF